MSKPAPDQDWYCRWNPPDNRMLPDGEIPEDCDACPYEQKCYEWANNPGMEHNPWPEAQRHLPAACQGCRYDTCIDAPCGNRPAHGQGKDTPPGGTP